MNNCSKPNSIYALDREAQLQRVRNIQKPRVGKVNLTIFKPTIFKKNGANAAAPKVSTFDSILNINNFDGAARAASLREILNNRPNGAAPARELATPVDAESATAAVAGERLEIESAVARARTAPPVEVNNTIVNNNFLTVDNSSFATVGNVPGAAPIMKVHSVGELIEFASVERNKLGQLEFHLGLHNDFRNGFEVRVVSYGNRRIGLRARSKSGADSPPAAELEELISFLKKAKFDVVEALISK